MTDPIRRDPCNVATTLPTADPDLAAPYAASNTPAASVLNHEAPTTAHLGVDLLEMGAGHVARASGTLGHLGHAVEVGCEAAGLPLAIGAFYRDFYHGIICASTEGAADGMLRQALGGSEGTPASPGRQMAFICALSGISARDNPTEFARLARTLSPAERRTMVDVTNELA